MLSPDPCAGKDNVVVPAGAAKELLARTWVDAGRRVLAAVDALVSPTVESIRAFSLLLQWWMVEGGRYLEATLSLTGSVVSGLFDLQLNRDPREVAPHLPAVEANMRRRLFWTLYSYECVARPMLGKAWQPFDESEISVDFPTDSVGGEPDAGEPISTAHAQAGTLNRRVSKALTSRKGTSPDEVSLILDDLDDFLNEHGDNVFVAALARYSFHRLHRVAARAGYTTEAQDRLAVQHLGASRSPRVGLGQGQLTPLPRRAQATSSRRSTRRAWRTPQPRPTSSCASSLRLSARPSTSTVRSLVLDFVLPQQREPALKLLSHRVTFRLRRRRTKPPPAPRAPPLCAHAPARAQGHAHGAPRRRHRRAPRPSRTAVREHPVRPCVHGRVDVRVQPRIVVRAADAVNRWTCARGICACSFPPLIPCRCSSLTPLLLQASSFPDAGAYHHSHHFFTEQLAPPSPPAETASTQHTTLMGPPSSTAPQPFRPSRPALSLFTTVAPPASSTKALTPLTLSPWIDAAVTPSRYAGDFLWNPQF